jgi:hypothetical protein
MKIGVEGLITRLLGSTPVTARLSKHAYACMHAVTVLDAPVALTFFKIKAGALLYHIRRRAMVHNRPK